MTTNTIEGLAGRRAVIARTFGFLTVVLGGVALAGKLIVDGANGDLGHWEPVVGLILLASGVVQWMLPSKSGLRLACTLGGLAMLAGSMGFHVHAIRNSDAATACGCLSVLGPMTHGTYLAIVSAVAALGALTVIFTHRRSAPSLALATVLLAGFGGWILVAPAREADVGPSLRAGESAPALTPVLLPGVGDLRAEPTSVVAPSAMDQVDGHVQADHEILTEVTVTLLDEDHELISVTSTGLTDNRWTLRRPGLRNARHAVLEIPGRSLLTTPVVWNSVDRELRGLFEFSLASGAGGFEGQVVDPQGKPVPGLDLVIGLNGAGRNLVSPHARARALLSRGHPSVRVTTDESGRFSVNEWAHEAVFVRVATWGWIRLPEGFGATPAESPTAARGVALAPQPRPGRGNLLEVVASRILDVAVRLEFPVSLRALASDELLRTWCVVRDVELTSPKIPHVGLGWSSHGDSSTGGSSSLLIVGSKLALDPVQKLMDTVAGHVVVEMPGLEPARAELVWKYRGEGGPSVVRFEAPTAAPGSFRVRLAGIHARLQSGSAIAWGHLWHVGRGARPEGTRRAFTVHNGMIDSPLPLVPGEYELDLELGREPVPIQIRSGQRTEVELAVRATAGLSLSWDLDSSPPDVNVVVASRTYGALLRGKSPTMDMVAGLQCPVEQRSPSSRTYWFSQPVPRTVVVIGGTPAASSDSEIVELALDTLKEHRLVFRKGRK